MRASISRRRSDTRRLGADGMVLAAWLAFASIAFVESVASAESPPRLLVLPFVVHSAEDPAYLRDGLSDMLNARLARMGNLELVPIEPGTAGTTQIARARQLASRLGADYVLFGSFTRFGQGASLDVQCASTAPGGKREPLREIFVHSGSIGDIIPDLDELAGKAARFAHGESVASTAAGTTGVAVSVREYQALLARVAALEKSLSEFRNSANAKKKRGTD